ncbi:MAG: late competence development ComFB family protein [Thiohalomonadaceae bacterium]
MFSEDIYNYHEKLLLQYLQENLVTQKGITDKDLLADIACIALNRLPPHYVRHTVDTIFFLSDEEQLEIERQIENAVNEALEFIQQHNGARS